MKNEVVTHPFPPLYNGESKILILGSFPSVKSREQLFYYGHPQNRFWKVVSKILSVEEPTTIEQKKEMLLKNSIALWDVIRRCEIKGSSDSSIKNVVVNNIKEIVDNSHITHIYCNGNTSKSLFDKYIQNVNGIIAEKLPSTSPANAAYSIDKLVSEWEKIAKIENI